jgi:hypothetical protein
MTLIKLATDTEKSPKDLSFLRTGANLVFDLIIKCDSCLFWGLART